jgi:hypothetical protein
VSFSVMVLSSLHDHYDGNLGALMIAGRSGLLSTRWRDGARRGKDICSSSCGRARLSSIRAYEGRQSLDLVRRRFTG